MYLIVFEPMQNSLKPIVNIKQFKSLQNRFWVNRNQFQHDTFTAQPETHFKTEGVLVAANK